jgi:DNA-binding response OmpR family regulator
MRLVVLEDDPELGESLARLLRCMGHRAEWASETAQARAFVERGDSFDAAIADMGLAGGEDGLTFLRWLRAEFPRVRRILMSGIDRAANFDAPLVQAFLRKPFGHAELEGALRDSGLRPECR